MQTVKLALVRVRLHQRIPRRICGQCLLGGGARSFASLRKNTSLA